MSIRVSCICGHQFSVKDAYAGKSGKCPQCQKTIKVPAKAPSPQANTAVAPPPAADKTIGVDKTTADKPSSDKPTAPAKGPIKPTALNSPNAGRSAEAERLSIAREVHHGLLPRATPELAAFEIAGMCQPAVAVGGDYFDYIPLPDGSLGVAIGDASGHGLGAALMMSQARVCLRSLGQAYADVGTIFTLANRVFSGALPEDYYATLTLARLDLNTRFLTYASAGHPTSYVFDTQGNVKWRLESTDCPLGLLPHSMYGTSNPLRLEPGEVVLMVTNGILKARSGDGSPIGAQRLLETVAANCRSSATSIIESLRRLAVGHLQNRPPDDDLTAVIIKAR